MNSDFISKHLGVERTAVWDLNEVKSTRKGLTEGDQTTVEIIKELREVLNGKCNISVLSREEVRDLLDYLCTAEMPLFLYSKEFLYFQHLPK